MKAADEPGLSQPHVRCELIAHLSELQADDPRPLWRSQRERGLVADIDQVFHFFFDDHDFDGSDVGVTLLDQNEVQAIQSVKVALDTLLAAVGDVGDDDFVEHPHWPGVRRAAVEAHSRLAQAF